MEKWVFQTEVFYHEMVHVASEHKGFALIWANVPGLLFPLCHSLFTIRRFAIVFCFSPFVITLLTLPFTIRPLSLAIYHLPFAITLPTFQTFRKCVTLDFIHNIKPNLEQQSWTGAGLGAGAVL